MKIMKKTLFAIFLILIAGSVWATDFTPQGNINLRDYYNITNVPYYNGTDINLTGNYYGNGSELTGTDILERNKYNDTQFEEQGDGNLGLVTTWLSSFIDTWLLGITTDDITEGSINLYDNQSWNQSYADTLYIAQSEEANLNVNSSTWWGGVSGWVSGWFIQTGNNLDFNETKLNQTIELLDTDTDTNCSSSGDCAEVGYLDYDNLGNFNVSEEYDICIENGNCLSEAGTGSGDITEVNTDLSDYLLGGSASGTVNLNFNETLLNNTIIALASGSLSFTDLDDTPSDYSGNGEKCLAVNVGEDGLEFVDCGSGGETYYAGQDIEINASNYISVNRTSLEDYFDTIYALAGSVFSGSWNDLSDIPAGFSDGVDNDTDTTYTAGNLLYLDGTEFNVNDTELNETIDGFGYITSADSEDTNETVRVDTITGDDCGVGNYSYGFDDNGNILCREDETGGAGSDTNCSEDGSCENVVYLDYANTGDINASGDICITGGNCLSDAGTGSGDITSVDTDSSDYLSGGSDSGDVTLDFNETLLNATIDDRDDDTTYSAGSNLTLVGTTFNVDVASLKTYFDTLYSGTFSGSWDDLSDVPSGFADGVDNDTDTNTNIIDDNLFNTSELEEQGDNKLGVIDSFIDGLIDDRVTASFVNNLFVDDLSTDDDTTYTENSPYLTLAGTVFGFSESNLNDTIDARDDDTTYSDLNEFADSGNIYQEDIGSDCSAGDFVKGVDDNGDLDCATPTDNTDDSVSSSEFDNICSTNDRIVRRVGGTWQCFDDSVYYDDTNTQLSEEQVEDYVGGMVTGNTETGITVTYQDGDGTIDFVVSGGIDGSGATNNMTYWTDSDTIGASPLYYNVGTRRIGLFETAPEVEFEVNGDIMSANFYTYTDGVDMDRVYIGEDAGESRNPASGEDYVIGIGAKAAADVEGDTVAVGVEAGRESTGDKVSAFGEVAGRYNVGDYLTSLGYGSGASNVGNYSALLGAYTGITNLGNYATLIGYNAGSGNEGDYVTSIGANSSYGNTIDGLTAIGYMAGYDYPGSWSSVFVGYYAGTNLSDGTGFNTFIGDYSGKDSQGGSNVFIGRYAGSGSIGNGSVFVGNNAGKNANGDDSYAMGREALENSVGYGNIGLGKWAGKDNTGTQGIFLGVSAGEYQEGNETLGLGVSTLYNNTGDNVVGIGYDAGRDNTDDDMFFVRHSQAHSDNLITGNFSSGNVEIRNNVTVDCVVFSSGGSICSA